MSPNLGKPVGRFLISKRELMIVHLVTCGLKNREIAEKLHICDRTVRNHMHNIFHKIGVSSRLQLALYAIHHDLYMRAE